MEGKIQTDKILLRVAPRRLALPETVYSMKISANEGYRLSKPISFNFTDLLYIDALYISAASESKLNRGMNMVKRLWKIKCAVVPLRSGVHVSHNSGCHWMRRPEYQVLMTGSSKSS